jgi:SAM-dependent methyltransferase
MALYAATVFLAAFLLFQIQPMIAKMILPWFGGSSAVWSTCMLFFQVALLLGYLYAHWLHEGLSARWQRIVHTLLLLASLAVLPVAADAAWKGSAVDNPSWRILGLLAATVGLPYFLLSTTSPLLQSWYARTHVGAVPYRLFALSNLACMLALLTYPVLVEPSLSTRVQAQVWSGAYACFAVLCVAIAWRSARKCARRTDPAAAQAAPKPPGRALRLLWVALAACASILLLSVTTYLTQDVAAVPFLWILPLSVYLLSFILCFEAPRLYWRAVYLPLLILALGAMAYMLWPDREKFRVVSTVAVSVSALFVFSMVCHGELVRTKPHPRHLTIFYVMLSLGGATGGLFVGLLAPNLFNAYYEFPIGLALCAGLAVLVLLRERRAFFQRSWGRACGLAVLAALGSYVAVLGWVVRDSIQGYRVVARNFYSQLRVLEVDEDDGVGVRRKLLHGAINHGEQILSEVYRRKPVAYFCPETGIGRAMLAGKEGVPRRIGILGLGCGVLAAYGHPGDTFRIYEINPLVLELARSEFTYLRDTPARVEVVLGDGRLSLEREPDQHFDILVMDAFSGDSVPVHLITREAFRTYLRHLKPGGILAVNVSNKYLDLRPVMERVARHFGKVALYFSFTPEDDDVVCFGVGWVLIVDAATGQAIASQLGSGEALQARADFRIWTDDFSNMYRILK